MKAMKSRMLGMTRRGTNDNGIPTINTEGDTPEANAVRAVRQFCEAGNPTQSGEEVVHLPAIIECSESSPTAARECANLIRKYLSKDNNSKPYLQYNAIMLMRILADNPGPTFTRNIDAKFVTAVKDLLRVGKDLNVKQMLIETLQHFDRKKRGDDNLSLLLEMFRKEQDKWSRAFQGNAANARGGNMAGFDPSGVNYFSRPQPAPRSQRTLPTPEELSSRVEESRTSASLLTQLVQSTPPSEFFENDLIKEFHQRCQKASKSMEIYMQADQPPPDNDTMLTLIETNEILAQALSKYNRTVLDTRKKLGIASPSPATTPTAPTGSNSAYAPPAGPPPSRNPVPVASGANGTSHEAENPFNDPVIQSNGSGAHDDDGVSEEDTPRQPYHPGFRPTMSYTQRQESAAGKMTMHAAIPDSPVSAEEEDEEYHASRSKGQFRY